MPEKSWLLAENIPDKSVFHLQISLPSYIVSKKELICFSLNENITATDTLIITFLYLADSTETVNQDELT